VFFFVNHRHTLFGGKYDNDPLLLQNIILDHIKDDIELPTKNKEIREGGSLEKGTYEQEISEVVEVAKKYGGLFTIGDVHRDEANKNKYMSGDRQSLRRATLKIIKAGIRAGIFEKVSSYGVSFLRAGEERRQIITLREYRKIKARAGSGFTGAIYRLVNYSKGAGSPPP